jgi:hypothetical protein
LSAPSLLQRERRRVLSFNPKPIEPQINEAKRELVLNMLAFKNSGANKKAGFFAQPFRTHF